MNDSFAKVSAFLVEEKKRVTRLVLQASLLWNNGGTGIGSFLAEDGIFFWHNSMSAGEKQFGFLESIGVLLHDGRRGYRLAIRLDAINLYADYLVTKGLEIETVIDALVNIGGESWLETTRKPFAAGFYEHDDGTTSFDCRQLMLDLVSLGYACKVGDMYAWTPKMVPILKANYH